MKKEKTALSTARATTHTQSVLFFALEEKAREKKKKVVFSVVPHDFGVLSGYEK